MLFANWFRRLKQSLTLTGSNTARVPHRQLQVECLEDRTVPATFRIVNNLDSGAGSLRQAILDANQNSGPDEIITEIPVGGGGSRAIYLESELPTITDSVVLDAFDEYGGDLGVYYFGLDATANGLHIAANHSTIRGLLVGYGQGNGILVEGDNNLIERNEIFGYGNAGVAIEGSGNVIRGNIFQYNRYGVLLGEDSLDNQVGRMRTPTETLDLTHPDVNRIYAEPGSEYISGNTAANQIGDNDTIDIAVLIPIFPLPVVPDPPQPSTSEESAPDALPSITLKNTESTASFVFPLNTSVIPSSQTDFVQFGIVGFERVRTTQVTAQGVGFASPGLVMRNPSLVDIEIIDEAREILRIDLGDQGTGNALPNVLEQQHKVATLGLRADLVSLHSPLSLVIQLSGMPLGENTDPTTQASQAPALPVGLLDPFNVVRVGEKVTPLPNAQPMQETPLPSDPQSYTAGVAEALERMRFQAAERREESQEQGRLPAQAGSPTNDQATPATPPNSLKPLGPFGPDEELLEDPLDSWLTVRSAAVALATSAVFASGAFALHRPRSILPQNWK